MINYNKGDILVCKKNYLSSDSRNQHILENDMLIIDYIDTYNVLLKSKKYDVVYSMSHNIPTHLIYVWDYFYTKNELRIKKITEITYG